METKICGATRPEEIAILEHEDVRYCGLWTGIAGHPNDLSDAQFASLAACCRNVTPVAVCVRKPVTDLVALLRPTRVRMVQLHGFNTPRDVAELKAAGFTVIKTLHLADQGQCPEARWIAAYDAAGCDIYLMDRFGGPDQIGSCGKALGSNPAASGASAQANWLPPIDSSSSTPSSECTASRCRPVRAATRRIRPKASGVAVPTTLAFTAKGQISGPSPFTKRPITLKGKGCAAIAKRRQIGA